MYNLVVFSLVKVFTEKDEVVGFASFLLYNNNNNSPRNAVPFPFVINPILDINLFFCVGIEMAFVNHEIDFFRGNVKVSPFDSLK